MNSTWWNRVRSEAVAAPTVARRPLTFEGSAFGSVAEPLAELMLADGIDGWVAHAGGQIELVGAPDACLAVTAAWLRDHRHAAPWRHEAIAVTTEDGRRVGQIERAAVRNLGIATQSVQLHGRVHGTSQWWLQQRALDKSTDPGRWDTLVGGLVSAGEIIEQTFERETAEEAGLRFARLLAVEACGSLTLRRPVTDAGSHGYMVETLHAWHCDVPEGTTPVNQDGEVARFDRFGDAAIDDLVEQGELTLEAAIAVALCRGERP